ncbi:MAG: hypothetical protein JWR51_415 [Devosia sp.]|uniref:S1 family peptidase n=1 Tax=Devosia sp. TaxID=1871048 RepID=UPI00262233DF|nr:serine protease [Devosia sp.]MDB5527312.1 hypothetical protein [Devosia sp.]
MIASSWPLGCGRYCDKPSNRFPISVLRTDKHRDLALLDHSDIPETEYYQPEKTQGFGIGEPVTAVGYPGFGKGDRINVRPGFVASFFVRSAVRYVEVTQKLLQGSSGGPLLDSSGRVIAVIHKGGPLIERDHAIHVDVIAQWVAE